MKCRLCGAGTVLEGERSDVTLHRCGACGFVSGHARDESDVPERYRHYHRGTPPAAPEYRYEAFLAEAERRIGRGQMLEVGAGRGGFVRVAVRRGWSVCANEVSDTGLEQLRETGAEVVTGPVERAGFASQRFDFVVSLEVLEHLHEPAAHLRELARITRPGGLLLLTTPNFGGLSRRRLGLRWRVIDPEHVGYFTPRTLRSALREAGYTRPQIRSRSLDISTWSRPRASAERETIARFDPQASAELRDAIQSRPLLRMAREAANVMLSVTGLGDALVAWAVRGME